MLRLLKEFHIFVYRETVKKSGVCRQSVRDIKNTL